MFKPKIVLIGPERSGKTTIANSLYDLGKEQPQMYRPTVGARVLKCEALTLVNGKSESVEYVLWDVSGDSKYESIWPAVQQEVDGVILVANGDVNIRNEQLEYWVKSFPKKMRVSPQQCMGIANHPSGRIAPDAEPFSVLSIPFTHSCFEERTTHLFPLISRFIAKIVEKKARLVEEEA